MFVPSISFFACRDVRIVPNSHHYLSTTAAFLSGLSPLPKRHFDTD